MQASDLNPVAKISQDDVETENQLTELKLEAPRVTLKDLADNIEDVEIVKHVTKRGKILRWAVITTKCGFAITGKPSAAVSAANDRPEVGEQIAIQNAHDEMWGPMGYHLACELAKTAPETI